MKYRILAVICVVILSAGVLGGCGGRSNFESLSHEITSYRIDAELNYDDKTLHAKMEVDYHNNSSVDFDELKFHLYPNAFREDATTFCAASPTQKSKVYPNGFSEGGISICSVKQNCETVNFSIGGEDKNLLIIPVATLKSGARVKLDIEFDLVIPNCNHRFGYGDNTLNLGNWYPVACVFEDGNFVTDGYSTNGDPFFSEVANYTVSITYPQRLILASSGDLVDESVDKEKKTSMYSGKVTRDFALVFSEKFEVISASVGSKTVSYYYFDDDKATENWDAASEALTTFSEMFGEYPYANLTVVKADFFQGGMEYPTLVYVSSGLDIDDEYKEAIIHEVAHQWWYGVVGNNECEYAWIDEGLAEYSTALFYDQNPKYNKTSQQVLGQTLSSYLLFCDVYREVYDNLDTSMNRNIHDFNTETEYVYLTYVKGVLMFDSIGDIIGEAKMQKALKHFYEQNKFGIATPSDLIEAFETVTHKKLAGYILSWLDGSVVIEALG